MASPNYALWEDIRTPTEHVQQLLYCSLWSVHRRWGFTCWLAFKTVT